jgi:nicotinamide riboside kinase
MKTIKISGEKATGKNTLVNEIKKLYNNPYDCYITRMPSLEKVIDINRFTYNFIKANVDLIVINDIDEVSANMIIKIFKYAEKIRIERKFEQSVLIDVPDLLIVTN